MDNQPMISQRRALSMIREYGFSTAGFTRDLGMQNQYPMKAVREWIRQERDQWWKMQMEYHRENWPSQP